ncbi:YiiX/YebB-like N1pC/P60 family cysteine hydrolase [Pontiellaceae bacterium B12219]|nr:YiiX/YebB-like N1pC/P60 family cysteine hydrolase [Pontiellaceae bacterium B12219]
MLKNKRLLLLTLAAVLAAVVVLGMKIAYPSHRLLAFTLLGLGWIPLVISWQINRRLLQVQKLLLKKKTRPFRAHGIVALLLVVAFYITWALFPVEKSPLVDLSPEELQTEMAEDFSSYLMLRETADDFYAAFRQSGLLGKEVSSLTKAERTEIRERWRAGVMAFVEFDLLKGKYRGFYQIDYVAEPELHANAFLLAYMAIITQYNTCLHIVDLVGDNAFMETLLNEEGEGIPPDSYFFMKQRLTHPNVVLRLNAAAAYYELVKKDITWDQSVVADFESRRKNFFQSLEANAAIFIENPLSILERAAFETLLPVQKKVAVQMSYIRTTDRDYLITPELLAEHQPKLQPGDILIQRRNWHMTNIGIPGFWPHVALYVGTPDELKAYFSDLGFQPLETIKALYPDVFQTLETSDEDGFPMRVIEAIRPGVVFQSLETSAHCDYLAVIRPNLGKISTFKALLGAFANVGKPYDLNFDFTTDNELVCSELVYKAYRAGGSLPLKPEVISGRRLLPPNRLAEQAVASLGPDGAFSFVLFLDAVEKTDEVKLGDVAAFKESWQRPKWDVLQE